jgi:antitoxin PrlF
MVRRIITGRLTTRGRTTIPLAVRAALGLQDGDELAYRVGVSSVILIKARKGASDDPLACFDEWSSEADRLGYAEL